MLEAVAKPAEPTTCHSEPSEEARHFKLLDPSLALRMTEKIGFAAASMT
jgi:hypothetical protein